MKLAQEKVLLIIGLSAPWFRSAVCDCGIS